MNLANGAAQVGNEEIIMSTRVSFGPQAVGVLKKFPCLNGRPHRLPHAIEKSGTGSVSLEDKVYMRNSKRSFHFLENFQCSARCVAFAHEWQPAFATQRHAHI